MSIVKKLQKQIFEVNNEKRFNEIAIEIFQLQAKKNIIYNNFLKFLKVNPLKVQSIFDIPFLPIEFFKYHQVISENCKVELKFKSSGTTGIGISKHLVADSSIYEESFIRGFEFFFGNIEEYCLLALLPSYYSNQESSLLYMINKLIQLTKNKYSGFFLNNLSELMDLIHSSELKDEKVILFGVSYALMDLAEKYKINHHRLIVMETGGMKGKRQEIIRQEIHKYLCKRFNVYKIYSEYGMTELLSQAYSFGDGIFNCPPWMKIFIRDINDPFSILDDEINGGINIIDFSNIHSCSFIMSDDLGKKYSNGTFEVLGRIDNTDLRGCNLLVQ